MINVLTNPASLLMPEDPSLQEIVNKRNVRSKTYAMPDGTRQILAGMGAAHYKNDPTDGDEEWKEIDLTIMDEAGKKVVRKAFYDLEIYTDRVGYRYTSKQGGTVSVELVEVGSQPVDNGRFSVQTDGNQLFWDNVADGVDMKIQLRPMWAEIFKKLTDENSPRSFKWKVSEGTDSQANFSRKSAGVDSAEPKSNVLEILNEITPGVNGSFYFEEEWTGRVAVREPQTRQKSWSYDAAYPVIIDAVTTENTVANVDDGWEFAGWTTWFSTSNNWYAGVTGGLGSLHGGVRFRTLGVPQGATINSASLTFNVTGLGGAAPQTTIYGDDVNSAALWANGNLPSGITKTAASTNWSATATGATTIGVTSIVQEIITRPGWVSNNDIRFGVLNVRAATAAAYVSVYDYQQGQPNAAVLSVNYTPRIAPRAMYHQRKLREQG